MSRGVPDYRTTAYNFRDTRHAVDLFSLKETGNIYSRIMNPTCDVLENRLAALERGGGALALASGTSAIFYSIINICQSGDEVVSARNLSTLFHRCRKQHFLVFSIVSDVCFYPEEQEDLVRTLEKSRVPCRHITVHSEKGHDAFLLEPGLFTPHLVYTLQCKW